MKEKDDSKPLSTEEVAQLLDAEEVVTMGEVSLDPISLMMLPHRVHREIKKQEDMKYTKDLLKKLIDQKYNTSSMIPNIVSYGIAQEMLILYDRIETLTLENKKLKLENRELQLCENCGTTGTECYGVRGGHCDNCRRIRKQDISQK